MRIRILLALLLLLPFQELARAESPDQEAASIIRKADEAAGKPAELRKLLPQVDAAVDRAPSSPVLHFARGYVRSELGDKEGAIAAYRKAVELDPAFAGAHYNLGNLLTSAGRLEEGIAEFDAASRLDPKNADAPYNAGQSLYLLGRFEEALVRWKAAKAIVPDDFQTARKIVQALNALGREAEAAAAREEVLRIHRDGKDPAARDADAFCFDQFVVDGWRVFAYEPFDRSPGIPVYLFKVTDRGNRQAGTIDFVGAPDGGYLLRVSLPAGDAAIRKFPKRPDWRELKPTVESFTRERFIAGK